MKERSCALIVWFSAVTPAFCADGTQRQRMANMLKIFTSKDPENKHKDVTMLVCVTASASAFTGSLECTTICLP
jgi:hypothetical protein